MGFEKEQPPIYADKRRRERIPPDVSGRPAQICVHLRSSAGSHQINIDAALAGQQPETDGHDGHSRDGADDGEMLFTMFACGRRQCVKATLCRADRTSSMTAFSIHRSRHPMISQKCPLDYRAGARNHTAHLELSGRVVRTRPPDALIVAAQPTSRDAGRRCSREIYGVAFSDSVRVTETRVYFDNVHRIPLGRYERFRQRNRASRDGHDFFGIVNEDHIERDEGVFHPKC